MHLPARFVALVSLCLGAAACAGDPLVPLDELPAALRVPDLATAGWERVERPGFSFLLPPGFEKLDLQPIDSDAGVFARGETSTIHYDHGAYSAPIQVPAGATEVVRDVRTRIGGREATLIAYREGGEWMVGARWDDLGASTLGELSLLLSGRTPHADVRDEILAAIHSVRFPAPGS